MILMECVISAILRLDSANHIGSRLDAGWEPTTAMADVSLVLLVSTNIGFELTLLQSSGRSGVGSGDPYGVC